MKRYIVLIMMIFLAQACQKDDPAILDYYKELTEINNDIIYQVHLSLNETRKLSQNRLNGNDREMEKDYSELKKNFDSIANLCEMNLQALDQIGPFGNDSILYNTFRQTVVLVQEINQNEFADFLANIQTGEKNASRINALYSASVKLADHHIQRIDSILKFNDRYDLNLDTMELNLSKVKSEKFITNISVMHNSVVISGDCYNGYGQIKDSSGSLYTGQFRNGLFHGKGKLIYKNGEYYDGEFRNGSFHGHGKYQWKNGALYDGEWREDLFNGIGTMVDEGGDTIYGYWRNGILKKF